MSSVLTPEYVMEQLGHAQRLLEDQRPGFETQLRSLEHAAREKESAVRDLLRLIQRRGPSPLLKDEYQKANQEWTALVARLEVISSFRTFAGGQIAILTGRSKQL